MKYLFSLLGVALLMCWLSPSLARAEDSGRLRLITSPLPVLLTTTPGKSTFTELRIRNGGDTKETLQVGLLKFKAFGDSGSPKLLDREPGDDFFDWVTFSETKFSIAPNEWHTVKMTISPPASAAFGYYYAVTFSRAAPNAINQNKPQTELLGSPATLILLNVDVPNAKREVKISSFAATKPWYEFLPAIFSLTLQNTGNVHVAPRGNIFITKGKKPVATIEVNSGKGNILPDSTRTYTATWADGFPVYHDVVSDGAVVTKTDGTATQELSWDFGKISHLRWGKYTALVTVTYDDGHRDVPLETSVDFWVIPWRLVVGSILAVVGMMALGALALWLMQKVNGRGRDD